MDFYGLTWQLNACIHHESDRWRSHISCYHVSCWRGSQRRDFPWVTSFVFTHPVYHLSSAGCLHVMIVWSACFFSFCCHHYGTLGFLMSISLQFSCDDNGLICYSNESGSTFFFVTAISYKALSIRWVASAATGGGRAQ